MRPSTREVVGCLALGLALIAFLQACGSRDIAPRAAGASGAAQPFTHVIKGGGCKKHIGAVRLAELKRPEAPPVGSGPSPDRIHTTASVSGSASIHAVPQALDGLPRQGFVHRPTVDAVFYAAHPVDGLTYDQVRSRGGIVVSVSQPTPEARHVITHLPRTLTRVKIGDSRGWIYQDKNWSLPDTPAALSVNWVTAQNNFGSLSADRSTQRLVSIARSFVC